MLSLQYDLEQQRKQLEVYSSQLQELVEERTQALHDSEKWHRSLFENATEGIVVLDRDGIIVNINDKACEMHGFSRDALIGTHIKLLDGGRNEGEMAERMRRILDGDALIFEVMHRKKDGTPIYLEISSKRIIIGEETLIQSFFRDITEKKNLQQYLFQSQKMESIGTLAGGIAHDFNNILTAILGHSDIIRRTNLEERAMRSLNVIEEASRKAGRMISKLLGFARKSNYEIVPLNINDVIFETVKLLEMVIDKQIKLTVELDHRLPNIMGDVNQLEQVVMNLIVNARDAMPKGGSITIRSVAKEIFKGSPDVPAYIVPGEYVMLSVSDTGTGMPKDVVEKVFEPFFTTKERGKGTGLGLSMVYGTVKEHHGYITVHSTQGVGTVFTIFLPAPEATVSEKKRAATVAVNGNESLLIVDDEEGVLASLRDTLESHGYRVVAFSDPAMAVEAFRKLSDELSLVIADIVMPRINGKEFISRIKAINPDVKILAISGYTKYVAPKEELGEISGFLQKPFESYYLLSVVRRILDSRRQDPVRN